MRDANRNFNQVLTAYVRCHAARAAACGAREGLPEAEVAAHFHIQ